MTRRAERLNSASVHINRALKKGAIGDDIAAELRSALAVVHFAGPLRMGTLAAKEHVSAPAVTRTVEILERRGLVRRRRDPDDERASLILTTAKGSALVERGRDERVRRIDAALRRLTPAARRRIAGSLGDLEDLIRMIEVL